MQMTLGKLKKIVDDAFAQYGDAVCDADFLDEINIIKPFDGCEESGEIIGTIKIEDYE